MAHSNLMSRGTIVARRDLFLTTDYREQTKLPNGKTGTASDYLIAANMLEAGKVLFLDDYDITPSRPIGKLSRRS